MVFADVVLVVRITAIANADALDRESKNIQLQLCLQPCEKEDTGSNMSDPRNNTKHTKQCSLFQFVDP
jgi:hypothetical protein